MHCYKIVFGHILVRYIDAAAHLFANDIAKILERQHHNWSSARFWFLVRPVVDAVICRAPSFLSLYLILLIVFTECGHINMTKNLPILHLSP